MKRASILVSSSQAAAETAEKKGRLQTQKIRTAEAVAQAELKVRIPPLCMLCAPCCTWVRIVKNAPGMQCPDLHQFKLTPTSGCELCKTAMYADQRRSA